MTAAQRIILALRVMLEVGIVLAFAWWGFQATGSTEMNVLLEIGTPIVAFACWGLIDFRWAGGWSEPLRLIQELAISGVAAAAWYVAGQHAFAWALAGFSIGYHVLVYLTGERLLETGQRSG